MRLLKLTNVSAADVYVNVDTIFSITSTADGATVVSLGSSSSAANVIESPSEIFAKIEAQDYVKDSQGRVLS